MRIYTYEFKRSDVINTQLKDVNMMLWIYALYKFVKFLVIYLG